jgi:hypothetical protein
MAADFRLIISDAKKQRDAKMAEEASAHSHEQERRIAQAHAGIGWLQDHALPLLQQARKAFEEMGLYAEIGEAFDADPRPFYAFFCAKPPGPRDFGGQVKSETLFINCDGESVRVGYGEPGARQPGDWSAPQPVASADMDKLLGEAIRRVAKSYYDQT